MKIKSRLRFQGAAQRLILSIQSFVKRSGSANALSLVRDTTSVQFFNGFLVEHDFIPVRRHSDTGPEEG